MHYIDIKRLKCLLYDDTVCDNISGREFHKDSYDTDKERIPMVISSDKWLKKRA